MGGDVDAGLTRLHVAYSDTETRKIIVMMSDGANTTEFRIGDTYGTGLSLMMEVATGAASFLHYLVSTDESQYYSVADDVWISAAAFNGLSSTLPTFLGARQMDWPEAWGNMSTTYYNNVMNDAGPSNDFLGGTARNGAEADPLMLYSCAAAANEGVTVYIIGFEMNASSVDTLRDCASSVSHFYDANGTQISEVFSAIATSILKLKLVN